MAYLLHLIGIMRTCPPPFLILHRIKRSLQIRELVAVGLILEIADLK